MATCQELVGPPRPSGLGFGGRSAALGACVTAKDQRMSHHDGDEAAEQRQPGRGGLGAFKEAHGQ